MSRLSSSDYALLLDCIREMHSLSDLPALRLWLVETALPRLLPADWFSYNEVDLRTPSTTVLMRPDDATALGYLAKWTAYAHEHPLIANGPEQGDLRVRKISDFLTQPAYHRLGLYQEVYRHLGVEYQIAASVSGGPGHATALAISRQRRDFTERERELLQHLQPQLTLAFRNLIVANEAKRQLDETTLALKTLGSSAVVISATGRILRCEEASRLQMAKYFAPSTGALLSEELRRWVGEQLALGTSLEPLAGILTRGGPRGTLTLRLAPLRPPKEWLLILSEAAPQNIEAGLQPLGLSRRQSEVVPWLLEGKTNREKWSDPWHQRADSAEAPRTPLQRTGRRDAHRRRSSNPRAPRRVRGGGVIGGLAAR